MEMKILECIILFLLQSFLIGKVASQVEKSNTGVDFPCAPSVKLIDFEDKQDELSTLPPPPPPGEPDPQVTYGHNKLGNQMRCLQQIL